MRSRLRLVMLTTVIVGIAAFVVALTVVPSTAQKREIDQADKVAQKYRSELTAYVDDLGGYVAKRRFEDQTDYQKLHDEVEMRMQATPSIPLSGVTAYAREHSHDYRTAAARRSLELKPFRAFTARLEAVSIPRQDFVESGIAIVKINPLKLLKGFTIRLSGEPLRTEVVPAYKKARTKLLKQRPGPDEVQLARDLKTYVDDAISMTRDGADDIDAGRGFFFDFGDKPNALLTRLEAAQRAIAADVSTQVDALSATAPASSASPNGNAAV